MRDHLARDSYARVTHPYPDKLFAMVDANLDATSLGRELYCVRKEVEKDLPHLFRVAADREPIIAGLAGEDEMLSLELRPDEGFQCPDYVMDEHAPHVDTEPASFDLGEAQYIIDQRQQVLLTELNPRKGRVLFLCKLSIHAER